MNEYKDLSYAIIVIMIFTIIKPLIGIIALGILSTGLWIQGKDYKNAI